MRALGTFSFALCVFTAGCSVFPDRVQMPNHGGAGGAGGVAAQGGGGSPTTTIDAGRSCSIQTVVVGAVADAYISADYADANYGREPTMSVGRTRAQQPERALIDFDWVPSLSTGESVVAMRVDLTLASSGGSAQSLALYPITTAWRETQVTWKSASSASAWTTAGGDFSPGPTAVTGVPSNATSGDEVVWSIPILRKVVAATTATALDSIDSSAANGWLIQGADPTVDVAEVAFSTREGVASAAPRLEIDVRRCN